MQAPYARSHALTIILGTTSEQIMCPTIGVVQLNESSGFGELKSLIKQNPTSQFGAGAEETEIAEAQTTIGRLPDDYVKFVREFGWLAIDHYGIFGLGLNVPNHLDLRFMTLDERENYGLPCHRIPIMNDGGGSPYSFDVQIDSATAGVVLWDHDASSTGHQFRVASSFTDGCLDYSCEGAR